MRSIYITAGVIFLYLFVSSINVMSSADFSQIKNTKKLIVEAKQAFPDVSELSTPLILSIIEVESRFNSAAVGGVGETGLMQIRPSTFEWIMNEYNIEHNGDTFDRFNNIVAGMHYIKWLKNRLDDKTFRTIQAYNVGLRGFREGRTSIIYAVRVYTGSFKYILLW